MSETCCFNQLRRGEIFRLVGSTQEYVYWPLPETKEYVGLPLTEDCQGEHRLKPHGEFLYSNKAGKCEPLGVIISDLTEIPPSVGDHF